MASREYREIHKATQAKLGVTSRAVNLRREKVQAVVGMPNDIALCVVAQRAGVPIHKWMKDSEVLASVAMFERELSSRETNTVSPSERASRRAGRSGAGGSPPRDTAFALDKIKVPTGVLSDQHRKDAERMAVKVYPLLYIFENSAREFIDGHLTVVYGDGWWDEPGLVSKPVRDGVEINRKAEAENRTHSARNARPIYYTTFGDLVLIVQSEKGAKVFKKPFFPRATWFPELVKASEHTRNIVAHMNPLKPGDLRRLEVDFEDWLNQIKGHMPSAIP